MRLDYRVLWIDDQPKHVKGFQESIERHLKSQGFELHVVVVSAIDKLDATVGEHVHNDGIDLVLVDYDLGPGSGGEEVLKNIRTRLKHKDILFYSAADTEKLRDIAYQAKLDGVYFSTRLSLADDAISLIEKTLHKVLDIDHMRGVVMAATSDIDLTVEKSVLAVYSRLDDAGKAEFTNKVIGVVRKKLVEWSADIDKAEKKGGIEAIFKLKHLCTAADRLGLLLDELSTWTKESTLLDSARIYRDQVVPRRNKLAHLVVKIVNGERVLDGGGDSMNIEQMTELRCDLLEHRSNFDKIGVLLDAE